MKKSQKNTIKAQVFIFSLLLMVVLSYGVPVRAEASDGLSKLASSQVERQVKKDCGKDYKNRIRRAKSEYRKSRTIANDNLAIALEAAKDRGERIEARKKYRESIKSAETKLDYEMREARENYRKQISQ